MSNPLRGSAAIAHNARDMRKYAAALAPVIDAVHINVHAAAHRAGSELARQLGLTPGILLDLRYVLRDRSLSRLSLATVYRYGVPDVGPHLAEGTLDEDDGVLTATAMGVGFIDALYGLHADAAERIWVGLDVLPLAELVSKVVTAAGSGAALAVVAPPYEPPGAPAGLLLFNRLAVLRYQRADAHAAAWEAAGLSAEEMVALGSGELRARIEADTNERAAVPYGELTRQERAFLLEGLLKLV